MTYKIQAVIFDLDGTITEPYLDFDRIRAEMGGLAGPIWEAMQNMTPDRRRHAEEILHRHETVAAENSRLNPGAADVIDRLREQRRGVAVVTRNRHESVRRICQLHRLQFDSVITREDGPVKPDPFPVLLACRNMNADPAQSLVVGDYLFDLQSARNAGARGVLITTAHNYRDYSHYADYVIDHLPQIHDIIAKLEETTVL
jgi:HAD superfamily hydrolase (TIGR01509 family)